MTLKKFIENLNEFVKENPETLDMNVFASKDDEGNGFTPVCFTPSKGFYTNSMGFICYEAYDYYEIDNSDTNAVCIN